MLIREHTHSAAVKGSLNQKSHFLIVFSVQDFYVRHEKNYTETCQVGLPCIFYNTLYNKDCFKAG